MDKLREVHNLRTYHPTSIYIIWSSTNTHEHGQHTHLHLQSLIVHQLWISALFRISSWMQAWMETHGWRMGGWQFGCCQPYFWHGCDDGFDVVMTPSLLIIRWLFWSWRFWCRGMICRHHNATDEAANVKQGQFLKCVFLCFSQLLSWRPTAQELSSILRFPPKKDLRHT